MGRPGGRRPPMGRTLRPFDARVKRYLTIRLTLCVNQRKMACGSHFRGEAMIDLRAEQAGGGAGGAVLALTERHRQRLRALRLHRGWGPKALADAAGTTRQYVWQIESGAHASVGERLLNRVAVALGWPDFAALMASRDLDPPGAAPPDASRRSESGAQARAGALEDERIRELARQEAREEAREYLDHLRSIGAVPVEVRPDAEFIKVRYRLLVNAGNGTGSRLVDTDEYVLVARSEAAGRNLFAARVTGGCMAPLLYEGDTVLCERVTQLSQVPTGTMCVVTLLDEGEDAGGNVKYVEWHSAKVRLRAEDNTRIVLDRQRVKVEGVVFEIRRKV